MYRRPLGSGIYAAVLLAYGLLLAECGGGLDCRSESVLVAVRGRRPPCETFSAVRLLPDGPPLRSYDHASGFPWNTRKGWLQTQTGSILMRFLLSMVVWFHALVAVPFSNTLRFRRGLLGCDLLLFGPRA